MKKEYSPKTLNKSKKNEDIEKLLRGDEFDQDDERFEATEEELYKEKILDNADRVKRGISIGGYYHPLKRDDDNEIGVASPNFSFAKDEMKGGSRMNRIREKSVIRLILD